jgi:hypothetical protein
MKRGTGATYEVAFKCEKLEETLRGMLTEISGCSIQADGHSGSLNRPGKKNLSAAARKKPY